MDAVAEINVLEEVKKIIRSTLKLPAEKLDAEAGFESFGIDSIIAMELITNLSERFKIAIAPAQFTDVNTVNELAAYIQTAMEQANSGNNGGKDPDNAGAPKTGGAARPMESPPRPKTDSSVSRRGPSARKNQRQRVSLRKAADFVRRRYGIDLSPDGFYSLDDIVETLVSEYPEKLMRHYALSSPLRNVERGAERPHSETRLRESALAPAVGDIAIVGMSCRFPDAPDPRTFWSNLVNEKKSIRQVPKTRWNWKDHYAETAGPHTTISKWAALIEDVDCFDPDFFSIPPDEAQYMDPQERLILQEVYKALQDAGATPKGDAGERTGVFIGYEYAEYEQHLRKNARNQGHGPVFTSSSPTYYLANRISYLFNFRGPSESINVNCASSAVAINRAYYSLVTRESDMAIAGGVCLNLFVDDYIAGTQYGLLSPTGTCAVFDDDADGYTRGEGVGVIVLKRAHDAIRDNNTIYGVIKACHQNNRGRANTISEIRHESITSVLKGCYRKAAISPETISYIEVDGYSTKWGDSFEFEGIKNVFAASEKTEKYCALGSLKGNIGHLEPAGAIASVIKTALALHHKSFPATISKKKVSSFIDIDNCFHPLFIADKAISFERLRRHPDQPIRAGVNSFADSGVNVHILIEEHIDSALESEEDKDAKEHLFILSARDHFRLYDLVADYAAFISGDRSATVFEHMIYTLQTGREAMEERLAVIAASKQDLLRKLTIITSMNSLEKRLGQKRKGIFHGNIAQAGALSGLITKEMSDRQVASSLESHQWEQIALLWINGVDISWDKIWENKKVRRVSLPGYPFAKQRFWADIRSAPDAPGDSSHIPAPAAENNTPDRQKRAPVDAETLFNTVSARDSSAMTPARRMALFLKQETALQLQRSINEIDDDRSFPALGLDSLGIASLIHKTIAALRVSLSPSVVFTHPTIGQLADHLADRYPEKIENLAQVRPSSQHTDALFGANEREKAPVRDSIASDADDSAAITPADRSVFARLPLSFPQQRSFFIDKMETGGGRNTLSVAVTISGELNSGAVEKALNLILSRHESLRTIVKTHSGGVEQVILDDAGFKLKQVDLSHYKKKEARGKKAKQLCLAQASSVFDVFEAPLIKGAVIKLEDRLHILMLSLHHLVGDGWSVGVLMNELALILTAWRRERQPVLPILPIQYADYALWQRNAAADKGLFRKRLAYWKNKLAGVTGGVELASAAAGAVSRKLRGGGHTFKISGPPAARLRDMAAAHGCTLYMALMAVFKILFHRYSGQNDICTGSVVAGRDRLETSALIGCFFDVLPIRVAVTPARTFEQVLEATKTAIVEAGEHHVPIEMIVDLLKDGQSVKNTGFFNILFNQLATADTTLAAFADLEVKLYDYGEHESLNLSDLSVFIGIGADEITVEMVYSRALFHDAAIEEMATDYRRLLARLCQAGNDTIGAVCHSIDLFDRKKIIFSGSYSMTPLSPVADLVVGKMPRAPKVVIADYNQVLQSLSDAQNTDKTCVAMALMLSDCYRYKPSASLSEKRKAVQDYIGLLVPAIAQTHARPVLMVLHQTLKEKITDQGERAMLDEMRGLLANRLCAVNHLHIIDDGFITEQYDLKTNGYDPVRDEQGHLLFGDDYYTALALALTRAYYSQVVVEQKKVIVVDCDNTLWKGVMGEDGIEGIEITPHHQDLQRQLRRKKEQGFLLALCSKNNAEDVEAVFRRKAEMVLEKEDIALSKINWRDKADNIKAISRELNIGLDAFVFIDDDPLEIEAVRNACPDVLSLQLPGQVERIGGLVAGLWCLDKRAVTHEDRNRTRMIHDDIERRKAARVLSPARFIEKLNLVVEVAAMTAPEAERASQLTLRTNQFNACKQPYTASELMEYRKKANQYVKVVKVRDRFGDYGLAGLMAYRKTGMAIEADQFLLSCRALGRRVEVEMIKKLASHFRTQKIIIRFSPSDRNQPARRFFEALPHEKAKDAYIFNKKSVLAFNPDERENSKNNENKIPTAAGKEGADADGLRRTYLEKRSQEAFLLEMADEARSVAGIKHMLKKNNRQVSGKPLVGKDYGAPQTSFEKELAAIWADLLARDPATIGVNDNFFDMGGSSLLALNMISGIQARLNCALPLTAIFSRPTLHELAELIESGEPLSTAILAPMQTKGKRRPIFAVPGAGGSVMALRPLSEAFGDEQPFYGFQAIGLDGKSSPAGSIEKTAQANIAAMKTIQAAGPYRIMGYSNGGLVAYEMARALLENKERVQLLAMLDSIAPGLRSGDLAADIAAVCQRVAAEHGLDLKLDINALRALNENERAEYLYTLMTDSGLNLTRRQFMAYHDVALASEAACRDYKPAGLTQKINAFLFRAREHESGLPDDYGWNDLLVGKVRIHPIQADHFTIIEHDAALAIVSAVNRVLRKRTTAATDGA